MINLLFILFSSISIGADLYGVIESGDLDQAKLLLEAGAHVDGVRFDITPFILAVACKHWDIADLLLAYGANIDFEDGILGTTQLYLAAYCIQDEDMVERTEFLLSRGANINADKRDEFNNQFISDNLNFIKLLLPNGAKTDILPPFLNPGIKKAIKQYNNIFIKAKRRKLKMPLIEREDAKYNILIDRMYCECDSDDILFNVDIYYIIFAYFNLNDFLSIRCVSKSHHALVDNNKRFQKQVKYSICHWGDIEYMAEKYSLSFKSESKFEWFVTRIFI